MKKCAQCGHPIKADQQFCPVCGARYVAPRLEPIPPVSYQEYRRPFWRRIIISLVGTVVLVLVILAASANYNRRCLSITKDDCDTIWLVTPDNQTVNQLAADTKVTYAYRFHYNVHGSLMTTIYNLENTELGDLRLDKGRLTYRSIAKYVGQTEGTYKTSYHPVGVFPTNSQKLTANSQIDLIFKKYTFDDDDPSRYQYDAQIDLVQSMIKRRLDNGNYALGYRTSQPDSDDLTAGHNHRGYLITLTKHSSWQAVFQYR